MDLTKGVVSPMIPPMAYRVVLDTNVLVSGLKSRRGASFALLSLLGQNRFEGNSFVGNLTPLALVGQRTDTVFDGNYWSDNGEPDLDGDGRSDRPFPLASVFDHLRGNLTAADLFSRSVAARALGAAERGFPVLREVEVFDHTPLAHPPALPRVPQPERPPAGRGTLALAVSGLSLLGGAGVLLTGRRQA